MSIFRSWRLRIAAIVVAALALSGVIGGVVIATQREGGDPPPFGSEPLLAASRNELAICIQALGDGASEQANAQVRAALANLQQHPRWQQLGYNAFPARVDASCPSDPYLLRPGVSFEDGKPNPPVVMPVVDKASPYRAFVFVLSPEKLAQVVKGSADVRIAPQEVLCYGNQCATVSTGVYVSPVEVQESAFLMDSLAKALGVEPAVPQKPGLPPGADVKP